MLAQPIEDAAQLSGSWYDPSRNGEGFHIEIQEGGQALVIWFTYPGPSDNAATRQAWILGTGTIQDNVITITGANKARGPIFGDDFDKDDLNIVPWGDLTFTFTDLSTLVVEYDGSDGAGVLNMTRLTGIASPATVSTLPSGISGAWYNPETNGQGWFVEILSSTQALVYMFSFDDKGNQAWNLNTGKIIGRRIIVEVLAGTGTGFGPAFNAADASLDPFGVVVLDFDDCDAGTVNYLALPGVTTGTLPIERLTRLQGHPCQGSLPAPTEQQLSLMTNPSDPVVERYNGLGGTEIDTFGSSNEDGSELSLSGALTTLPDGGLVRTRWNEAEGQYVVEHGPSGTKFAVRVDSDGNRFVTVVDAEGEQVFTSSLPTPEAPEAQVRSAKQPAPRIERDAPRPAVENVAGQVAKVRVNYCEEATPLAEVDIVVGDSQEPIADPTSDKFLPKFAMVVPTTLVQENGEWLYEGHIPVNRPEFQPLAISERCSRLHEGLTGYCRVLSTQVLPDPFPPPTNFCAEIGPALFPPGFALSTYKRCFESQAAVEEHCAWWKFREVYQCPSFSTVTSVSTVFRLPREDFWGRASLAGVTQDPAFTSATPIDLNVDEYATKTIDLGSNKPAIVDAYTDPLQVLTGSDYDGVVQTGCVEQGARLEAVRRDSDDEFGCTVGADGLCTFSISAAEDFRLSDTFDVTGPNGLQRTFTVNMLLGVLGSGLSGNWAVQAVVDARDCDEGIYNENGVAALTQSGNMLTVCSLGVCLEGQVDGSSVSWSGSYPEDGGTTTTSVSGIVTNGGSQIVATSNWNYTEGQFSCQGSSDITATKL